MQKAARGRGQREKACEARDSQWKPYGAKRWLGAVAEGHGWTKGAVMVKYDLKHKDESETGGDITWVSQNISGQANRNKEPWGKE